MEEIETGDFQCSKCGKVKERNGARCVKCNTILKGFSLKAYHSQKSDKLSKLDQDTLVELIQKRDTGALIGFLVERAKTTSEAFKILKEFMPYLAPKLQSIQQQTKEDKTITIQWEGMDSIDVTPDAEEIENLDDVTPTFSREDAEKMLKTVKPKKRGRPPGSKNKKKTTKKDK